MAQVDPPPTYDEPVRVDEKTQKSSFSPIWLDWFVRLGAYLSSAGAGTGTLQHNSLGGLQGGAATNDYYHVTAAQNSGLTGGTATTLHKHSTGVIVGTATNDNAAAGNIGEYASGQLASGSATSLTTATAKNITTVSLTAGDWDVTGVIDYVLSSATTTDFKSGSSSTSATFGAQDTSVNVPVIVTLLSDTYSQIIPLTRFSLASTTTIYLVGQGTFSAGTMTAYGTIRARRVR